MIFTQHHVHTNPRQTSNDGNHRVWAPQALTEVFYDQAYVRVEA